MMLGRRLIFQSRYVSLHRYEVSIYLLFSSPCVTHQCVPLDL